MPHTQCHSGPAGKLKKFLNAPLHRYGSAPGLANRKIRAKIMTYPHKRYRSAAIREKETAARATHVRERLGGPHVTYGDLMVMPEDSRG